MGGVLFIDEAYYLFRPENERDYGQEVIEILLQEMESERDSMVVIFAGYTMFLMMAIAGASGRMGSEACRAVDGAGRRGLARPFGRRAHDTDGGQPGGNIPGAASGATGTGTPTPAGAGGGGGAFGSAGGGGGPLAAARRPGR